MPPRHLSIELLSTLEALLAEGSVTGAADRLGIGQPAVSRALARLRRHFADELFVRAGRGLRATRRARQLLVPARRALAAVAAVDAGTTRFDPRRERRRFQVAAHDYAQLVALVPLAAALAREAPGIDLVLRHAGAEAERDLESGMLDLLVGLQGAGVAGLVWSPLWSDGYVCAMWRGARVRRLTARTYAGLDHVLVAPRERPGGPVDEALLPHGLARRVAVQVPSFLVAGAFLVGTERVATVPARMATLLAERWPLRLLPPPVRIPGFTIAQAWHEVHRADPGHRWLRERLVAATRSP